VYRVTRGNARARTNVAHEADSVHPGHTGCSPRRRAVVLPPWLFVEPPSLGRRNPAPALRPLHEEPGPEAHRTFIERRTPRASAQ
jgi:hypothetical protein